MPLSPKIQVNEGGIHGYCWFAGEDIKKGDWLWKVRPPGAPHTDLYLTVAQVAALPKDKRDEYMSLAYQVDDNTYLGLDFDKEPIESERNELYVNHSCDGNAWYMNDDLLVAMRDIKAGEEICYDYALTEGHAGWKLAPQCLCGKQACRGVVTGNDWKLPQLQAKYGNHFLSYILKKIEAQRAVEAKKAAVAEEEEYDEEEEEEEEPVERKKPSRGKKRQYDDDDYEPTRRSARARRPTTKAKELLERKTRKVASDDDEESSEEEVPEPPRKRGRKKKDADEDYEDRDEDDD